jgi:hypothetical protein
MATKGNLILHPGRLPGFHHTARPDGREGEVKQPVWIMNQTEGMMFVVSSSAKPMGRSFSCGIVVPACHVEVTG